MMGNRFRVSSGVCSGDISKHVGDDKYIMVDNNRPFGNIVNCFAFPNYTSSTLSGSLDGLLQLRIHRNSIKAPSFCFYNKVSLRKSRKKAVDAHIEETSVFPGKRTRISYNEWRQHLKKLDKDPECFSRSKKVAISICSYQIFYYFHDMLKIVQKSALF